MYTCQSLGKGFLPRIETDEAYDNFHRKADVEQFTYDVIRQSEERKDVGLFVYGMLPYKHKNGTFLSLYGDFNFDTSIQRVRQIDVSKAKTNIKVYDVLAKRWDDDEPASITWSLPWEGYEYAEATCIIQAPGLVKLR